MEALRLEYVDPASLQENPLNWRTHPEGQREALDAVLDEVGWAGAALFNETTGRLIDGHLRKKVATTRDEPVPVLIGRWTEAQEQLILATLDPIAALAQADAHLLQGLLAQVENEAEAVQTLLSELATEAGIVFEPDSAVVPEAPEPRFERARELQKQWGVELGQIWQAGEHRLACGDCRDFDLIAQLFAGDQAAAMWTDPPYGVAYVGKTEEALTLENDAPEGLPELLEAAFEAADRVLAEGAPIYIAHPAGALSLEFGLAFLAAGWHLHETLVWFKDSLVLGHSDYHYQHEPILYGWKGKNRHWYAGRDQVSIFEIPRPKRSLEHPTMKPVELVEVHLANSTKKSDRVFDPFLGSGTTLLACERLGRCGRGVELDPLYFAVILQRLAEMGLTPEVLP